MANLLIDLLKKSRFKPSKDNIQGYYSTAKITRGDGSAQVSFGSQQQSDILPGSNIPIIENNTNPTTSTTTTTTTEEPTTFNVTNDGSSNYIINGQTDPTLNLTEGQTYTFNINAIGHPFWIKTVSSTGTGNAYSSGVTNNGTDNGTITFVVPYDAPSTLYYNCQFHSSMAGTINVIDVPTTTTSTTTTTTTI